MYFLFTIQLFHVIVFKIQEFYCHIPKLCLYNEILSLHILMDAVVESKGQIIKNKIMTVFEITFSPFEVNIT